MRASSLVGLLSLLLIGAGCPSAEVPPTPSSPEGAPTSSSPSGAEESRVLYQSAPFYFEITRLPSETVRENNTLDTFQFTQKGRAGGVLFGENTLEEHASVSVYRDMESLERDFRVGNSELVDLEVFMIANGLQVGRTMIDGKNTKIFYGIHAVDGVGGETFPYVAAAVQGDTYAYMIQLYGHADPSDSYVTGYLNSFRVTKE